MHILLLYFYFFFRFRRREQLRNGHALCRASRSDVDHIEKLLHRRRRRRRFVRYDAETIRPQKSIVTRMQAFSSFAADVFLARLFCVQARRVARAALEIS